MAQQQKVLYIVPQPFFVDRGGPFRVRATVKALAEFGASVDLLVFAPGEGVEIPGVTVKRTWKIPGLQRIPPGPSAAKALYDVLLFCSAALKVLSGKYTVIHGIEEGGFMAALLARLSRTPFVFEMYSSMSEEIKKLRSPLLKRLGGIFQAMESFTIRRASAVISLSEMGAAKLRKVYPDLPVCFLKGFPAGSYSTPNVERVEAKRAKLELHGKRVVLYTGSAAPHQGLDLLLRSFAGYLRAQNDADSRATVLLLVGGAEVDNERWSRYRQLALNLGIEGQVVITGQRPGEAMSSYLAVADLAVSPRLEGTDVSMKIYSYMAAGVPILATALKCHTPVLDEQTAILAEPTLEAFTCAFQRALSCSSDAVQHRASIAANAKQRAESQFRGSELNETLRDLYQQLEARPLRAVRPALPLSISEIEEEEVSAEKGSVLLQWSAVGIFYLAILEAWWRLFAVDADLF